MLDSKDILAIVRSSYFHLLTLYVVMVFLLAFDILPAYAVNILWFAIILGVFGMVLEKREEIVVPRYLVIIAILGTLLLRVIPYIGNTVPLGYDPGLYKYVFEHPFSDQWTKSIYPLPFSLIMSGLQSVFGSWFLLVPLFIALSASTSYVIYYVVKKLFDASTGVVAALLFMVSITQFENFWFMYYKNVIGIILLLLSFLYFKNDWRLAIVGVALAGVHRPAFFIFGVTYLLYVLVHVRPREASFWKRVGLGTFILVMAFIINFDRIDEYMLSGLLSVGKSFVAMSGGPGTFFDIQDYVYYSLPFIPFAITGLLHHWKKNIPLFISTLTVGAMVLLQLFFYNRFIIYMDIFVIIYAALGFMVLMRNKNYGMIITTGFVLLMTVLIVLHAMASEPLISEEEFHEIQQFDQYVPESILVTDRHYSPWIKGWVNAPVIAPGLFDENIMSREEWIRFWKGEYFINVDNISVIHVGRRQPQFTYDCPIVYEGKGTLYEACN